MQVSNNLGHAAKQEISFLTHSSIKNVKAKVTIFYASQNRNLELLNRCIERFASSAVANKLESGMYRTYYEEQGELPVFRCKSLSSADAECVERGEYACDGESCYFSISGTPSGNIMYVTEVEEMISVAKLSYGKGTILSISQYNELVVIEKEKGGCEDE
jgi:hypothetical protein